MDVSYTSVVIAERRERGALIWRGRGVLAQPHYRPMFLACLAHGRARRLAPLTQTHLGH
jgi:hypothetical protein